MTIINSTTVRREIIQHQDSQHCQVTVTISPLPSLRMTNSHSILSPVSRHTTSVGSTAFIRICRRSRNDLPSTISKCGSSDKYTGTSVVLGLTGVASLPSLSDLCSEEGRESRCDGDIEDEAEVEAGVSVIGQVPRLTSPP